MANPQNTKRSQFLIRVDGSETIGTGHIMRCLALAGELKKQGHGVSFLSALCPDGLKKRLVAEGHLMRHLPPSVEPGSPVDARYTSAAADESKAAWVVLDGYHFTGKYQHFIKDARLKSLYIDDLAHCNYYCADIVLNQNPSAAKDQYEDKDPQTRLLLGTQYLLISNQFRAYKKANQPKEIGQVTEILLTMGGADKDDVTGTVMRALSQAALPHKLTVTAIIGASNTHGPKLQQLAQELNQQTESENVQGQGQGQVHQFKTLVNVANMSELLGQADLVVSAGGTTVWEAAYLARPLAVIITADNQKAGMEQFAAQGAISLMGEQQNLSPEKITAHLVDLINDQAARTTLSQKASALVDGEGVIRLVQALTA